MTRTKRDGGAAAVEFALVLPLLLLLVCAIIDFGRMFWEQSTLSGAAREGVRLVALGQTDPAVISSTTSDAAGGISDVDVTVSVNGVVVPAGTDPIPTCTPGDPVEVVATTSFSYWTPLPGLATFTGVSSLSGKGVMRCGG